ncbi:MAG: helix-turn-helix transcriptional regulator [Gemmatimonadales bacterium]|nr:helix-turn-helix transcriptional regulator [Gemmatimonadales bacterium]
MKLLIVFCNLLFGAAISVYIYQAYRRYASPPLKPMFYQIICLNLGILLLLTTKYQDINIGTEFAIIPPHFRSLVNSFLIYFFFAGFSYSSWGIYLAFLEKKITRQRVRWIAGVTIILIAGIFIEPFLTEGGLSHQVHYHIYENVGAVFILLELGLMITLPIKAGRLEDKKWIKVVRAFSFLYLARFPFTALLIIIPQPFRLLLGLLMLNLVPLLWYRLFMLPYIQKVNERPAEVMDLGGIAEHYKLSPRETEILGLIMDGKSNRDMEEDLFISYHTVKNHVYNLYRKLGVKSRFELLHLISNPGS